MNAPLSVSRGLKLAALLAIPGGMSAPAHAQVDLVVGDITSATSYVSAGSPKAYSLGVSVCNLGALPASFDAGTASHPILTQNLYRLQNGRFEQIGQAWVQHLSSAVQQNLCSTCNPWPDLSKLGAGCSSSDSAGAMGVQASLGAKSEVNASTGAFTWPRVNNGTGSGAAFKRLQADIADMPAGPQYFVSAMILSGEDSAAGASTNNESYRRVTIGFAAPSMPLSMADSTQRGVPAIQAWRDNGLGPGIPDPGVMLTAVDVPGDGRFWIASKATDLGNGMWHYEYAVQNLTSTRSAKSFFVSLQGIGTENHGFHSVAYHSGEPYVNAAWGVIPGPYAVTWYAPTLDANTSALRWDTLYNFRFDAPRPPFTGNVVLELFAPGSPSVVVGAAYIPTGYPCPADFNCDGDTGTDADIESFFACVAGNCPAPPCNGTADVNGDGDVGTDADIEAFFRSLSSGC